MNQSLNSPSVRLTRDNHRPLLVAMKMGGPNALAKLVPLSQVPGLAGLDVVRDYPGDEIVGVRYHCPPTFMRTHRFLCAGWKLVKLVWLSIARRPIGVHSFRLWPHGFLVLIAATATHRRASYSICDGEYEVLGDAASRARPSLWQSIRQRLSLYFLRRCWFVTCTGSLTKKALVNAGVPAGLVHVVHNALVESGGRSAKPRANSSEYDILFVGRLSREKHVEVVLDVVRVLCDARPTLRACIVGDGPEKSRLLEHASALGVQDAVDFVGYQAAVKPYYDSSKVLLLPSEREGFPLTFVEAMQCGLPVVTTRCGDIVDIARHETNCMLVDNWADTAQFICCVERLLDDDVLWRSISLRARESIGDFSLENTVREWARILGNQRVG